MILSCGWKDFSLLSTCTQRSLIDLLNALFLIAYTSSLLLSPLKKPTAAPCRRRSYLIAASACSAATGAAYLITGLLSNLSDGTVCLLRGITWISIAASLHTQSSRWVTLISLFWWISFSLLVSAYNLEVLITTHNLEIMEIIAWPVNFVLLAIALSRMLRFQAPDQDSSHDTLSKPLLTSKSGKSTSELYSATLLSRLSFAWLNPLLRSGRRKPLHLDDIPAVGSEDGALQASQRFLHPWQESGDRESIFFILVKCYWKGILLTAFYALLRTLSVSASPLLLYAFIWYSNEEERETSMGCFLVFCLVALKLVESLSQRHWFFESRRLGMRMRSALMSAVFRKQLKLSGQGRRRHSPGEVVNYIAVDAYRLGEFPWWLHMAWSLPLQLILSVAILFWALGFGALPGVAPLIVFGFLNVPFAKILQGYQSKFMAAQDERLRRTAEVLNNMKIIKLQSWEEKFRQMIESLREAEFIWLAQTQLKKAYGSALYWMSPTVVSAVMFAGAAALKSAPLNARTVFTVLATLRVMAEPVRTLPEVLTVMIQVKVSLSRIAVFLSEVEIKEEDVKKLPLMPDSELSIIVQDGDFSWNSDSVALALKNINLSIFRGQKVAICGPVGGGKSSLMYALLGEIPKISGSVEVFGSIAYVSQGSWIQSGTVRDNILFGKPFHKELYDRAIRCCALEKDIQHFDNGDLTEIGQRGLNLSGGQKQRIQLARAVYKDADTYLLDDPFSAVDAHTASVLFYDCVLDALGKKTVVLVTHQVEFLAETDRILVMENGQVTQQGSYQELLKSGTAFERLVDAHRSSIAVLGDEPESRVGVQTTSENQLEPCEVDISAKGGLSAVRLTEEEEKEIGDIGWKPYKDYLNVSSGSLLLALLISGQSAFVILQTLSTYWLAIAVQIHGIGSVLLVGVYAALSTMSCFIAYLRSLITAHLGLRASKAFFGGFMDSVFKAPMLFFDSTPVGRILTRASSDMSVLDFDIPYSMTFVVAGGIEVMAIIIVMATVTWQVLIIAIPIMIILIYVQRHYMASARELVRINGTTKAPVMNHAAESMLGVVTIRAFKETERFIDTSLHLIDTDASLFLHTIAALEWVLMRVEALQNLTIFTSAVFLVLLPQGAIAPGLAGLCLSYALTLTSAQLFMTRYYSYLENYIISVERIEQYMHIPPEPPAIIPESRPPATWPSKGRIDLQDLKVKYRANAPVVLKGITCTLVEGNKIGVVGRTGSGKSTLISAMYRLVDLTAGKILIDGLDICSIGLKDLRTKLSIIPQEPTLFRGTVRSNLDPLGLHTDHEIWQALEKCQLKNTISSLPSLLDSSVSDDGENWSAGQRQLFCLGRVLLRKNKILVLDEATASIDSATDAVLQRVIKQEFASCTVITVAHRVPTVTDSDMVMVLSYGKLVEYDTPSKLMETKNSAFSKLVAEYWSNSRRNSARH